jgi:pilus assembly protein CpaB
MRLDRRFVTVLAVSLIWSAVVAGVFYRMASAAGSRTRAESQKQIVVAARELAVGATVDRDSVKLRAVPDSMAPAGAYTKVEDLLERPVISPIHPEEPVTEARVAAKGSGMGLAPLIPSGMRAISVRVNDVVGVAGFILPGMHVDVLVTGRPPGRQDTVTRTVLQNIAVLSAGQTIQADGKSQSIVTPVVTLLVNPHEAESLTLANNEGHIQLVLRNSSDQQVAATRGRGLQEIFGFTGGSAGGALPRDEPREVRQIARATGRRAPVREAPQPPALDQSGVRPVLKPVEEDQMVIIRGKTKTVEVFARDGEPQ